MPVSKSTARKLATRAEWELLESSRGEALKALTPSQLKQGVVRARKLQDRYRDRARQQRGEARGKRESRRTRAAGGSANTRLKQTMFTEARLRFEAQLARREAATTREAERAARAAARAAAQRPSSRSARKPSAAKASTVASRSARKASAFTRQATAAKRAHAGARGRRRQARRDAR